MGHFWRTDLLRTRSEALICDEVFFFFNHKILFVVFLYLHSRSLDFVVSGSQYYFFDVDEEYRVIVHSPCSPVPFRSVSVGPLVSGVDLSQTKIPSPLTTMSTISNDALSALSECSRACIERLCKYEPEYFELTSPNQYVIRFVFFGPMGPRRCASDEANCLQYSTFLYALQACSRGGTHRVI